jgi:hypothetical protein
MVPEPVEPEARLMTPEQHERLRRAYFRAVNN